MGILYDIFGRPKKRCTVCGCYMYDDSDSDICEVCVDELLQSDPGEPEDVESLYPRIMITTDPGGERIEEIINRRVEGDWTKNGILEERLRLIREHTIYGSYGQLKPIGDPGGGK